MQTNLKRCDTCGNTYERCFEVRYEGSSHWFDSFECAIFALAPRCAKCGIPVVGHGVQVGGTVYCCANCSRHAGETRLRDSIEP